MVVVLLLLAIVWAVLVAAVVVGSAPEAGATLIAFNRELVSPGTPEGVWILCALTATAVIGPAWAIGAWRRRRQRARMSAELDARWAQRDHAATAEEARNRLLAGRERELDETIHTLTAQRDALLGEIAVLRAATPAVVQVPDAETEREAIDRAG